MYIYIYKLYLVIIYYIIAGEEYKVNLLAKVEDMDYSQLRMTEWQELYERHCDGDLQLLRTFVK